MKIVILAVGSARDVCPSTRLARQLINRKHNVTLIALDSFRRYAEENGVDFIPYPCNDADLLNGKTPENVSDVMAYMKKICACDGELVRQTLYDACIGADVLLYTDKSLGMVYIGESLQIPYIRLSFTPDVPTTSFCCIYSRDYGRGNLFKAIYNKLTHISYNRRLIKIQKATKKSWCKPLGIKNRYKLGRKYLDGSGIENLLGYSDLVVPECDDHKENIHVVGYFSDTSDNTYKPASDVLESFPKDTALVYVDSGIAADEYENAFLTVLEAVKLAGKRAVVGGNEETGTLPEHAFLAKDIPTGRVISRCEAVIQCGDAELTAIALAEGKPNLVLPISNEQIFWGNRIYERGLGPKPMNHKKLTAVAFSDVIEELCSPEYTERAEYIGKLLKAEDGASRAADFIEKEYGEQ